MLNVGFVYFPGNHNKCPLGEVYKNPKDYFIYLFLAEILFYNFKVGNMSLSKTQMPNLLGYVNIKNI